MASICNGIPMVMCCGGGGGYCCCCFSRGIDSLEISDSVSNSYSNLNPIVMRVRDSCSMLVIKKLRNFSLYLPENQAMRLIF